MNYIHALKTFLEQQFANVISTAAPASFCVPTAQLQWLLSGLSPNQFSNLISHLREEGYVLNASPNTIYFSPDYVAYVSHTTAHPSPGAQTLQTA